MLAIVIIVVVLIASIRDPLCAYLCVRHFSFIISFPSPQKFYDVLLSSCCRYKILDSKTN